MYTFFSFYISTKLGKNPRAEDPPNPGKMKPDLEKVPK